MRSEAVFAQIRVELSLTLRRGESLLVTLAIPLGVLVFFSKLDAVAPSGYNDPVDFLVPGVISLAVMSASMVSLGIATGFERRYGVLKRLGSTPLTRIGLIVAKTVSVLLLQVIQLILILSVATAIGWSIPLAALIALALVLVGSVAFAGIGLWLAGSLRAEATLALANALFLIMLFLGGMAYPVEKLPAVLESIAVLSPGAALSDSLRGVLVSGREFPFDSFLVLCIWAICAPLIAAKRFRWEE